jgi:hypothetical protein
MPRPKRILNGDDYKSKVEKQVNLPKRYPDLSKTEKMQYLPRFYYNNYEKIDDGFLDYIPLNYTTIVAELNLRPDTAFGYPTWGSVFGGFEFIVSNDGSTNPFLFNGSFNNTIDGYSADYNLETFNGGYIDTFFPFLGGFYSILENFNTEYRDNDRFVNSFVSSPIVKYIVLNFGTSYKNTRIQLFNNNRAKIVFAVNPV